MKANPAAPITAARTFQRAARRSVVFLALAASLALTTGCLSLGTATTPEAFQCELDPRLIGTWNSGMELSQLGPAGFRFRIDCECRFRVKARVFLFMTIRERGPVWSEPAEDESTGAEGTMVFGRADGNDMPWRYRFEGDDLLLEDAPGEWTRMRRTKTHRCNQHP